MKKIYIVTGANGFLGNNIIRRLEKDSNNEIRAFVLKNDSQLVEHPLIRLGNKHFCGV